MDKKIELLVKYDFSSHRNNFVSTGLGNLLFGIRGSLHRMKLGKKDYSLNLNELYSEIAKYYSTINFDELNKEDKDYRFLFDYRDKLIELGVELNNFYTSGIDYEKAIFLCDDLFKRDYRNEILSKYGLD